MYQPNERVSVFFKKALRTPEGMLLAILIVVYFCSFVFFNAVVEWIEMLGGVVDRAYRVVFFLMPFLLTVIYLRMDFSAKTKGDRVLTGVVLLLIAVIPVFRVFKIII